MNISEFTFYFILFCYLDIILCDNSIRIKIKQGWLEGETLDSVTGDCKYHSFKGIPFAKPPIGYLRFKSPRPPLPWMGVRDAKKHGPVCTQVDIFATNASMKYLGAEDCLFINVYTPNLKPKRSLSVLVLIHGGGFKSGSGNVANYGPDFLIEENIIVVTFNYRLDCLGFLCMNTADVPGNAGMKDQVLALKWVKGNIATFGGDPNKVTIMGQSAGGVSVIYHLISPMSKGLFERAISMSGVPSLDFAVPYQSQIRPYILGKQLGYNTKDPKKLLKFLQNLPVNELIDTYPTILSSEELTRNVLYKMFLYMPVVEKNFGKDNFLTMTEKESFKRRKINKADLLIGHVNQETLQLISEIEKSYLQIYDRYPEMLVPKKIIITSPPDTILNVSKMIHKHYFGDKPITINVIKEFIRYANDANFFYDIRRLIDALPNPYNNRRFFYIFSCQSERNYYGNQGAKYGIYGAGHLDDSLYLFDAKIFNMTIDKYSREYRLIKLTTKIFTNFIKYGTPNPNYTLDILWPEYNNGSKMYVDINERLSLKNYPDEAAAVFWKKMFDYAGLVF